MFESKSTRAVGCSILKGNYFCIFNLMMVKLLTLWRIMTISMDQIKNHLYFLPIISYSDLNKYLPAIPRHDKICTLNPLIYLTYSTTL